MEGELVSQVWEYRRQYSGLALPVSCCVQQGARGRVASSVQVLAWRWAKLPRGRASVYLSPSNAPCLPPHLPAARTTFQPPRVQFIQSLFLFVLIINHHPPPSLAPRASAGGRQLAARLCGGMRAGAGG